MPESVTSIKTGFGKDSVIYCFRDQSSFFRNEKSLKRSIFSLLKKEISNQKQYSMRCRFLCGRICERERSESENKIMDLRGDKMLNINEKILCSSCFSEHQANNAFCDVCGFNESVIVENTGTLPISTMLLDRYIVGKVLGRGGFGITYLAYDVLLGEKVAIKEYFPTSLAYRVPGSTSVTGFTGDKLDFYNSGAEKFYEEAKTISHFNGNPNIIGVSKFFYENNTAYYVMEYVEGMDLKKYIESNSGKLPYARVLEITSALLSALIVVHSLNILHRDISPDNIYITKDNKVKLLDFGAARQILGEESGSLSVILKSGFAPVEQYKRKGNQGPWTDIYALGATIYYCLTGLVPEDSLERAGRDNLVLPSQIGVSVPSGFEGILKIMMAVECENRFQSVVEVNNAVNSINRLNEKSHVEQYKTNNLSRQNEERSKIVAAKPKPHKKFKKIIGVCFVLALMGAAAIIGLMSIPGFQALFDSKRNDFDMRSGGLLYRYKGTDTTVVIPNYIVKISNYAFEKNTRISSVEIPDTVTSVGKNAFFDCRNLKNVSISDSVTSIGESAFEDCFKLISVKLPDGLTSISESMFANCSKLKSVSIPDSVMNIGKKAFYKCTSLATIKLPYGLTSISEGMFEGCSGLETITIPDVVTSIKGNAFKDCENLVEIIIPESVTEINTDFGENTVIVCTAGSYAEKYTERKGLKVQLKWR